MKKPQYGILRFAKYKGPEISRIEAHDERMKGRYASNPDIDHSRTRLNCHLIEKTAPYRIQCEQQIKAAGCRVRSDSVRLVETIVTASPEFFQGRSPEETMAFFREALAFLSERLRPETILSAVVHLDEKTPHMHLVFVPITPDGRLSAKDIVGNKKKLTEWQDAFWERMAAKYPELERGESASKTGRSHIPPRIVKEMTRLTRQRQQLEELLEGVNPLNAKGKMREIGQVLDRYIPGVEKMSTQLKKYRTALAEAQELRQENSQLTEALRESRSESVLKKMQGVKLQRDYQEALAALERIPPEILAEYQKADNSRNSGKNLKEQEDHYGRE